MRPNSARPNSARVARPGSARVPKSSAGAQHGDAVAASTAVKVAVRIRPFTMSDGADPKVALEPSSADSRSVVLNDMMNPSKVPRQFNFDHVFTDTQAEVFTHIGLPMVEEAYKGFNVCLFAYGQTGSGKTYCVQGDDDTTLGGGSVLGGSTAGGGGDSTPSSARGRGSQANAVGEGVGIVPRFVREMFRQAQAKVEEDKELTIKIGMAYLEVYNEKVRDLLSTIPKGATERESLDLHEDAARKVFVKGLGVHPVLSAARVAQLLKIGNNNRQRAETKMNEFSSRSHSIIQFTVSQVFDVPERRDVESVIWLVDLAGSERQTKAEATGQQLEEAKKINHSLLQLGRALNSFSEGRNEFLSLRESKLTRLLSECFGGNTKTWMLATVSPAQYNASESLSTLEYAVNAKKITNRAVVNNKAKQLEMKELREASTKLQAALEVERDQLKDLDRRKAVLNAEVLDLEALEEEALHQKEAKNGGPGDSTCQSSADGRPSGQLRKMLEGQQSENQQLRERIADLKKEYQRQVDAENAAAQKRQEEHQQQAMSRASKAKLSKTPSAYVGRCGISLSDIIGTREKRIWRLELDSDTKVESTAAAGKTPVLLVESYEIDDPENPDVVSTSPAPSSLSQAIGRPIFVYLDVIGAEGLPVNYIATSFVTVSACHDRVLAPQQSRVERETPNPVFHAKAVYALGTMDSKMLKRYSDYNIFSFELFGMSSSAQE